MNQVSPAHVRTWGLSNGRSLAPVHAYIRKMDLARWVSCQVPFCHDNGMSRTSLWDSLANPLNGEQSAQRSQVEH
jgi:hypothetical protein